MAVKDQVMSRIRDVYKAHKRTKQYRFLCFLQPQSKPRHLQEYLQHLLDGIPRFTSVLSFTVVIVLSLLYFVFSSQGTIFTQSAPWSVLNMNADVAMNLPLDPCFTK